MSLENSEGFEADCHKAFHKCLNKTTPHFQWRRWALIATVTLSACSTYHPLPIRSEPNPSGPKPPDMNAVRLQAASLENPLLKPTPFDDRDGLSPDEAAILAVIVNPTLRAVRDQRGIARAELLRAGILPNPKLSYDLAAPIAGNTSGTVNSVGLGLHWELTSLLSRNARLDAAKAHASSVDLEIAWQEWQVAEAARLHAYRVLLAQKRLATAKEAESSYRELSEDLKKGIALGVKTRLELAAAEREFQQARSQSLNAQSTMDQEQLALNRSLGLAPESIVLLEKKIAPQLNECPPVETLYKEATAKRLDLQALRLGYKSQEAHVRAAIRAQFPPIQLGLTTGRDTDNLRTAGGGLSIELPFFDRNQARIANERASRKQLFDEYAARLFETRSNIKRLVSALDATRQQLAALDESLSTQELITEGSRHAVDAGQIDLFSYYRQAGVLYNGKLQRIDLEQRLIDFGIALEISSGRYGLIQTASVEQPIRGHGSATEEIQ